MRSRRHGTLKRRPALALSIIVTSVSLLGALMVAAASPAGATSSVPAIATVTAGNFHNCVLTTSGGVKCWGANNLGQLGDSTTTDSVIAVDVTDLSSGATAIDAGGGQTCAVTSAGGVVCWGYNTHGELGDGTTTDRDAPVAVSGLTSGVAQVSAGDSDTCALTAGGGVKCWGDNTHGQLGDGTKTTSKTPVAVSGLTSGVAAISVGAGSACALTTGGEVKCWGNNQEGELGNGTNSDSSVPVAVSGLASGATAVAVGNGEACALVSGGAVKCWGGNFYGQLGDGTSNDSNVPVAVSGLTSGVASISAGWEYVCALTTAAGVKCWGMNNFGELGNGTNNNSNVPVDVSGLASAASSLSVGQIHTCAAPTGGGVKCWGDNAYGELGDGSKLNSNVPVDVVWFSSSLTFSASPLTLNPGDATTTLSGDLDMGGYGTLLGQTIKITRTNPDSTTTDVSTATDSLSHYSIDDELAVQGSYYYAATWIPDADHASPGNMYATVTVYRDASSLTLKASKKVVHYQGKVKLSVHLSSPTSVDTTNHVVDLAVTAAGKPTVVDHITVNSSGNGSLTLALKRDTGFVASYAGDPACCHAAVSHTKFVYVTIGVKATAINYYGVSGAYHLYHYTSTCPNSGKGCPSFVFSTSPPQGGQSITLQMQLYYSGAWHTLFTKAYKLNKKGKVALIILYKSTAVEGEKARLRGMFISKIFYKSTGNWVYFEVTS